MNNELENELMQPKLYQDLVLATKNEILRTKRYLEDPQNWEILLLNCSQNHDFIILHHLIGWNENVRGKFNGLIRCFASILDKHNVTYKMLEVI